MSEKVIVTGMGIISPLGDGLAANWKHLTNDQIRDSDQVPPTNITHHWGLSPQVRLNGFLRGKELAEQAATEALTDAGLWDGQSLRGVDPERVGCTVSASKPLFEGDIPHPPEAVTDFVVRQFGLGGESRNVIAACATGAYSIALAASWIEEGLCDVVVAGSVEPYPHPLIAAGFRQMGVTSSEGVTRPFDRERSGFTFGEGAGAVILESKRHFKRRGAFKAGGLNSGNPITAVSGSFNKDTFPRLSGFPLHRNPAVQAPRRFPTPYAVLSGWALGSDSHSAVAFNSNGAKIAGVIHRALRRGGLSAQAVRHVNAHGTATRLNDWIETQALLKAFESHAPKLMIAATKASTGHLLGACGAVEFIFTVLALARQYVPPTATLKTPDPECALDYTPRHGHAAAFDHALSLSFGFGGPIGVLVVSR